MTLFRATTQVALLVSLGLGFSLNQHALAVSNQTKALHEVTYSKVNKDSGVIQESKLQSRAFAFDNDILVPGSRDQDYTYGLNMTFSGKNTKEHWLSLHSPQAWLHDALGLGGTGYRLRNTEMEYGLFGFTPEDITTHAPLESDRPYASLIYATSTLETLNPTTNTSWTSSISLGVLGLDLVGEIQEGVHELTDGDQPQGWDTQISDGGELTAKFSLARQKLLLDHESGIELKHTLHTSIGTITEASWSLSTRIGNIHTPWASFSPEVTQYGENSAPANNVSLTEQYFWAGFALKARAYNVFLQGQFRENDYEYAADELNHGLVEAWLGYTLALSNGYRFTYSLRGHTSEIKRGIGDRNVVWGGLQFSKTLG